MSKKNKYLDPRIAYAGASYYGMENEMAVIKFFPALYKKMVKSFNDPKFIAKLHALKGREQITMGINIPKDNDQYCFINKIWFQVQKTDSVYWEIFYLNVGVYFNKSENNPFKYKGMMVEKAALGTIDKIRERVSTLDFGKIVFQKLSDHVRNTIKEDALVMFEPLIKPEKRA